ncbi:helix-turn-helix domain-containing protein [Micrococcus luteus]|uniref:helix-turn-helix domain-containing protein n=1 Tax=Micrococcus luteus TaxID=1270 RepID=UPI0036A6F5EE
MPLHTFTPSTTTAPALPAGLPLLDRDAAAELACVSPSTIQRWRAAGALPLVRIGTRVLYRRTTVLAYVAALTAPSPGPDSPAALVPPPAAPDPETAAALLSVETTRAALGLGATMVTELIRTGELPSLRVHNRRLVRAGDLAAFVDQHAHAATTGPLAGRLA